MKNKGYNTGRWNKDEHQRFMQAIEIYGKDWKKVQEYVGSRTSAQSRSHAQKVLPKEKLEEEGMTPGSSQKTNKVEDKAFQDYSEEESESEIKAKKLIEYVPDTIEKNINERVNQFPQMPTLKYTRQHSQALPEVNYKRKKTEDGEASCYNNISMNENDEVSQRLLQKLTTPKKTTRYMSF